MSTQDGYDWPNNVQDERWPADKYQPAAPYFRDAMRDATCGIVEDAFCESLYESLLKDPAFCDDLLASIRQHYAANPPVDMRLRRQSSVVVPPTDRYLVRSRE